VFDVKYNDMTNPENEYGKGDWGKDGNKQDINRGKSRVE